jgi:hypothetical protein
MTRAEVLTLINQNIATGSNITAAEHKAVEIALLDFIPSVTAPLAYGKIGPIDIKGSASSYTVTGNLISATKISTIADVNLIRIVFPSGLLSNQNFKVRIDIEAGALYSIDENNNLDPILFKKVSSDTDKFDLILEETTASSQDIYVHVEVIPL